MDISSSSYSSDESYFSTCGAQVNKEAAMIAEKIDRTQEALTNFFRELNVSDMQVNKCIVPHEMLLKQRQLEGQIKEKKIQQVKLSDRMMALHEEIRQLQARIAAKSKANDVIAELHSSNKVAEVKQQLIQQVAKLSEQESDSKVEIKTEKLQQQIARKLKSEETMITILSKKIEQEQRRVDEYVRMKQEVQKKLDEEKQLGSEAEADRRASKDQKLIDDRTYMLQKAIERMRQAIAQEQKQL